MKVLVVAGASAGHIFPARSFIDSLKETHPDAEVVLVLPKVNFAGDLSSANACVKYISTTLVSLRFSFKSLKSLFNFLKGALESLFILTEFRPDVVVGFGSLPSVALIMWAWLFRVKALIHEQNVIPGKATRFLSFFSDSIALSFTQSEKYFKKYTFKTRVTGNPIRKELKVVDRQEAADFFRLSADSFTLLVVGGSQGSSNLNRAFLWAVSALPNKNNLQIIHLAGPKDEKFLEDGYAGLNIKAKVLGFLDKMYYAYSASDILVSRAGATTISEAIFFTIPAILVPYPFAYQHQLKNAEALSAFGCAVIADDTQLKDDKLMSILQDFIANPDKIRLMRANYSAIPRYDSARLLSEQVLSLIR